MKNIIINDYIKALIFDCDGTLVDSMPLHMNAWEEAFKHFNVKFRYDFLYSLKGMKETEIIDLNNKTFGTSLNPDQIVKVKHQYFEKNISDVKPIDIITNIAKNFTIYFRGQSESGLIIYSIRYKYTLSF